MAGKRGRAERSLYISILELSLIILGFISLFPGAFLVAFVILIYFVVASSFNVTSLSGLSLKRAISKDRINDEEDVIVEETITNSGRRPVFLEIFSKLPEEIVVTEGSNHYVTYLKGKESRRISYKIKPSFTGHFTLPKTTIRTFNHLFTPLVEVEKEVESRFTVYPLFEELRKFPYGRMNVRPLQGVVPSRAAGHGTEFFEIRNYSPMDEFRRINWKASARLGALFSNEYEWEKMADIYMLLDSTKSSHSFQRDYIRACASLTDFFLRMGNRVGLIAIGKYWIWNRSGSGRKQLIRLVEGMIEERAEDALTLDFMIENSMRVIPQSSTVVFLSPMRDSRIRQLVRKMADRRQKIIAIVPSPEAEHLKETATDELWIALAKKTAKLARENALGFLRDTRVAAVEWDLRTPISRTLEVPENWTGTATAVTD